MLGKLGKYEIRRELGRGAMGVVYEAFDPFIERTVAIKTIQKSLVDKSEAAEVFNRFRREAQAAGRLTHPNIVAIYEYGEEGDMAYIAMEYVVGTELKEYFDGGERFEIKGSTNIMLQLLDALEYSHNRGVVHRDIKPSNILIANDGQIKIADFGIAKIEASDFTQVGTVLGTPSYMSPEQFLGETADRRSDLYSAGVILYQLLTGERPFTGGNMSIIMHKVLNQAPLLPSALNPSVSKALDEVVKKAMAKRPEDRFQSAAAFATAFKFAVDIMVQAGKAQRPEATIRLTEPVRGRETASKAVSALEFDPAEIEKQLQELRQKTADEAREDIVEEETELESAARNVAAAIEENLPAAVEATAPAFTESSLLAGLAREAEAKLGAAKSKVEESEAKTRRVHEALSAIIRFFQAFSQHVNNLAPEISRPYSFDARTTFSHLKWQRAHIDYRKQGLSESAHLAYATFSVDLRAPGPVVVKRPWNQLEALRKELSLLQLKPLDDLEELSRRPKQEWLEARLAAEFPVQMRFQGNYEQGSIDITCRNVGAFGVGTFKVKAEDITPQLMDSLGLFLLGRTDTLPAAMERIQGNTRGQN